jgi:predicted small lipoprotein YifL
MKKRTFLYLLALLLVISLAACAPAAQPSVIPEPAAETETALEAAPEMETTAPSEEIPATEAAATDTCIDCHTDKDQLILTGDPVVEEVEESKGAG